MNKLQAAAFKFAAVILLLTIVLSGPFNIAAAAMQDPTRTLAADKAGYAVTQADINADDDLVNMASVDTNQTNPKGDDATTTVTQIADECKAGTFTFIGNDALSGPAGNIKTFTVNGVNGRVSGWSKTAGAYAPAYVGVYSGGLGVTDLVSDGSGSNNQHTVDNNGADNYLLFEFDRPVTPDQIYMGYVRTDSDATLWFGNAPGAYTTPQTLSDLFLGGLSTEDNLGNGSVRWADFNGGGQAGNILVVAAKIGNTDDYFKVQKVTITCPTDTTSRKIFDNGTWWIETREGPDIRSDMSIYLNGEDQGTTRLITFGHKKEGVDSWPEIAAIYNTGYVRLVPYDLTYGTSFILGPSYWDSNNVDFHDIQISRIDIDTGGTTNGTGPIQMTIYARSYQEDFWPDYHLDMTYNITLPDPESTETKMQVTENFVVANAFSISPTKQSEHQGFKWVQFSSMYIDDYFQDSDNIQYTAQNGKRKN